MVSPPPEDVKRIAEYLFNNYEISDLYTFDRAWQKYMGDSGHALYEPVLEYLREKIDIEQRVKDVEEGREPEREPFVKPVKKFKRTTHKLKGKTVVVFRDARGRFIKK